MQQKQPTGPSERKRFPDGFRVLQGRQEFITYLEHSSVRVWPSDVAAHFETHTHSAVEIIMPNRGASVYRLADREYRVEADEILIIPPNLPHDLTEDSDILRYLILFEPTPLYSLQDMQQVSQITQQPIYLDSSSPVRSQVIKILQQLVDCYFQHKPMWNTQCYAYLLQVYATITAQYAPTAPAAAEDAHRSIDPEIMNMTINYLANHYMEDVTLEAAAAFAGYSKYYFSRAFKNYFGISFTDYLLVKRVNEAANLLIHTEKPIGDVAKAAGFGSIATFNRIFRKHKNCTPTRYRAIYSESMLGEGVW
ncbi:MAG: helix-turn-helix transcriptional regulator [Clostridia bacterium]|nr:helix-turn-helix transcriptional regulator [Clostridia bacterium]MBR4459435.1 helix-turn-helix transcriptional regulator [Clostridia bacterium]